jgi:LmbE family N-acetylglucosaminyl deacetylase
VGFVDKNIDSYNETVDLWGMDTTEGALIEIIRRYQPDVIVTHDVNGEYGHNQHKVTCAAVRSAVTKSGDPSIHPESAQQYGTYTPKKLYIHLYKDNAIMMSVYDEPSDAARGLTMTEVATIGYSKHVSQQNAFSMSNHGVKYDNRKYGLAFTTVGEDVEKNDFFENVE